MNSFSEIAVRYIKALFDLANEKRILANIEKDFKLLKHLSENYEIQKIISSPDLSVKSLSSIFKIILKKIKVNSLTINFLLVLIENRRIEFLNEIIIAFFNKLEDERGELKVDIITVTKIEKNTEKELSKSIEKITHNKNITINKIIDTSIIGGLVIKFGSIMIDSSIKTQLNQLKFKMKDI